MDGIAFNKILLFMGLEKEGQGMAVLKMDVLGSILHLRRNKRPRGKTDDIEELEEEGKEITKGKEWNLSKEDKMNAAWPCIRCKMGKYCLSFTIFFQESLDMPMG